jgi:hypothetical protein
MKVLLMGSIQADEPGDGASGGEFDVVTAGVTALQAAGHTVTRCFDGIDQQPQCKGMPGGSGCPLDFGCVDVAVAIGGVGDSPMVVDGVRCVMRHFVPLVTTPAVGGAATQGFQHGHSAQHDSEQDDGFARAIPVVRADGTHALAAAVAAAATLPLDGHGEVATAELRKVLAGHHIDAGKARAVVQRANGGLRVELFPAATISNHIAHAAAVRVVAVLRAYDSSSTAGIGVVLAMSPVA